MIREFLEERKPEPFKDVDPIHYFGTNQIESLSDFSDFIISLLMEKYFFRRRLTSDIPVDMIGEFTIRMRLESGLYSSVGWLDQHDEVDTVFKKAKELLQSAFPFLSFPPWNSSFHSGVDSDDIAIIVKRVNFHGDMDLTIKVNSIKKAFPQFHAMDESSREYHRVDHYIKEEVNEITEEVISRIVPSMDSINESLDAKMDEIAAQIEELRMRSRMLGSLKNRVHDKVRKETHKLKEMVYDRSDKEEVFSSLREEKSERDSRVASWCLL